MADITKLNEKALAWKKNLERLKNGEFGAYKIEGETEKALLRYWQAQAEADYPQASENVRYYAQLLKEKKMTEEAQIVVITYEEERLDYFTALMNRVQKKYKRLLKRFKDAPMLSEEAELLSNAGRETQFCHDVVEMLENRKQSEESEDTE